MAVKEIREIVGAYTDANFALLFMTRSTIFLNRLP